MYTVWRRGGRRPVHPRCAARMHRPVAGGFGGEETGARRSFPVGGPVPPQSPVGGQRQRGGAGMALAPWANRFFGVWRRRFFAPYGAGSGRVYPIRGPTDGEMKTNLFSCTVRAQRRTACSRYRPRRGAVPRPRCPVRR